MRARKKMDSNSDAARARGGGERDGQERRGDARSKYNARARKDAGRGRRAEGPADGGEREIESSRAGATEHLAEQKKPL